MLGENLTRRPDDPSFQLTSSQVDILRLLGKGNSFKNKDIPQQFTGGAEEELGKIYSSFGVYCETAAVVHALNIGALKTEELIENFFDWRLINRLKPQYKAILEAFTHAKHEDLTVEEFKGLNSETTQAPKDYIDRSIDTICGRLKLGNKTEAVVYYYAWRERQPERGEVSVPAEAEVLTHIQIRILQSLIKGLEPAMIAHSMESPITAKTVRYHKSQILEKLGAASVEEAKEKARELGILKS